MEPTGSAEAAQIAATDVDAYPRWPNSASAASRITSAEGEILSWSGAERVDGFSGESAVRASRLTVILGRTRQAAASEQCVRRPFVRVRLGSDRIPRWTDMLPIRLLQRARQFERVRRHNAAREQPQRDQKLRPCCVCARARDGANPGS